MNNNILWFNNLGINQINQVGGKNASLGEMITNLTNMEVKVPNGFATTAEAFQRFLDQSSLKTMIDQLLTNLDVDNIDQLTSTGKKIRQSIINAPLPTDLEEDICNAYRQLSNGSAEISVAVRSSATAEDLPDASFAGQQETFLNVNGEQDVLEKIKEVFASLYNDRAIAYRVHKNFEHSQVSLSAGIQKMVRSDLGASGVMFTLDTESGFNDVVFITSAYGLGETVVQGAVNPDEFYVYKPSLKQGKYAILRKNLGSKANQMVYQQDTTGVITQTVPETLANQFSLTDEDIHELARQALIIEEHYKRPMDIEWAKDGVDGKLYIVQARPETVKSRSNERIIERYRLKQTSKILVEGRSIGQKIGKGTAKIIKSISEMDRVQPGDVLVTEMTDPDWEPIMKRAAAIVTNRGGRTCHAAIIARELGIPAVVGCGDASEKINDNQAITVSCAEGDTGFIYEGNLDFEIDRTSLDNMPIPPTKIMMNVGNPDRAFDFAAIPNHGVGLARLEFIINRMIGIHPKALLEYDELPNDIKTIIDKRIRGYQSPTQYYIDRLAEGIATITAAFAPNPVIVRLSDFKSNEYANLIGGKLYEPEEENPMIGYRGASRYVDDNFKDCFAMECKALKKVREELGLENAWAMIPFVRTVDEAKQVNDVLAENGLKRGENNLKVIMMCELPSNALLAEEFLQYFDGFSIGSNDLTQLTLGLDRDSGLIAHLFDERNEAIKKLISMAITACHKANKYIGICGQGPSDHADLASWLLDQNIGSMSLNPDTVIESWLRLSKHANNA